MRVNFSLKKNKLGPGASSEAPWPLENGALPASLFCDEHLRAVLFDYLPVVFHCAASTVRQGLKAHLKRTAPGYRSAGSDQGARDRSMAALFGNLAAARDRTSEIVLIIEQKFSQHGRSRTKGSELAPARSFSELLWRGYRKAGEMAELHAWLDRSAEKMPCYGAGSYHDSETLKKALGAGDCPVAHDDLWLSRSIVLFAALLPEENRLELMRTAVTLGCEPIAETYFAGSAPASKRSESKPQLPPDFQDIEHLKRPKLSMIERVQPRWEASDAVRCQAETLLRAEQEMRESRNLAELMLRVDAATILDGPDDTWLSLVEAVSHARARAGHFQALRSQCEANNAVLVSDLRKRLGGSLAPEIAVADDTVGALAMAMTDIDAARVSLDATSPSPEVLNNWRASIVGLATPKALWDLVHAAEQDLANQHARSRFCDDVDDYCRRAATSEITAFLASLDSPALLAILMRLSTAPWAVAGAILLRVTLDKVDVAPRGALFPLLSGSGAERRALLRFVDPTSSLFDGDCDLRRLIAVERLRDAFTFGPLAQVSDPASGLSDVNLVGRSVAELIEIVVSNLDILSSGADLIRTLGPPRQDEAGARLLDFIQAPVTLSGNFRRLREMARERLLLPLLVHERPNAMRAQILARAIASDESLNSMIAAFEAERPDERLEARHRDQLARYLLQTADLLRDFLRETGDEPDARRRSFTTAVRAIRDKLRTTGELGSIEWLEAEVAIMLEGLADDDHHRTLTGDSTPILSQQWAGADREWAADFIDLPEFHSALAPTHLEVAASVLRWKSNGSTPTTVDIAAYLIERQAFPQALRIAQEAGDTNAEELVLKGAKPAVAALRARRGSITAEHRYAGGPDLDEETFEGALTKLDVDAAEEMLDFWQLALAEEEERRAAAALDPGAGETKRTLLLALEDAGLGGFDDRLSAAELEAIWADVLATRQDERAHLIAVASSFEKVGAVQTTLADRLTRFSLSVGDPKLWLPPPISADFAMLVQEAAPKISEWIVHSPSFRDEEKEAVLALAAWFLDFVVERSLSLHDQDETEVVQSGLERVLDIADIILQALKPSDCLTQLSDSGELDAVVGAALAVRDEEQGGIEKRIVTKEAGGPAVEGAPSEDAPLPEALVEAFRAQDWKSAIAICATVAGDASSDEAQRLNMIARSLTTLMDDSLLPKPEIADQLPAAAAWLSNQAEGALPIGESRRAELAFRLLTGAAAADSGQEIYRLPGAGGTWAELLRGISPFRRMLTTTLPPRTGRVVEALLSGSLAMVVAERIWDAATNLPDPQNYRAPLLNLLNDFGAQETIIKLAQRHETAIAPRLSQLFELRAVAQNRADLLPVAQSVAEQVATQAKAGPFRAFVRGLPSAAQFAKPTLRVSIDETVQLRPSNDGATLLEIPIVVKPEGLVPNKLFARLFAEDDVTFEDNSRLRDLSSSPIYFATDYTVALRFGRSWFGVDAKRRDSVRIRIEAKTVTDDLVQEDAVCVVRPIDRARGSARRLDIETLLELYPGVANNPVVDKSFVGRIDELERLHQILVSTPNPSPVLLTGMRRVGKTSLLYAFHQRCSPSSSVSAISIYQSLAERRVELASLDQSVSWTFFKAISHGLVRPNIPAEDRNHALCMRVRHYFNDDWKAARKAIHDCYDEESLSGSLMVLVERLRKWTGWDTRFIFLIDEAEALVAAYQAGGRKKIELEQFLQSLREVSQTTGAIGLLLSGSNHINMFAREYKNAFFGSSQAVELEGFPDVDTAAQVVAPKQIGSFVQFDDPAISYAWTLCAGMPQFLWQIGATTSFQVRSGLATRSDIRAAVTMLVGPERVQLPFKPYEMLEPIDSMLALETHRERDLLWMLLYRVAQASSLAAQDAAVPFVIDQSLLAADDRTSWRRRLRTLVDLKALRMESPSTVRFQVPLFAEAFRAPKNWQEFNIRQQQVAI
jgi:hypothetical protein